MSGDCKFSFSLPARPLIHERKLLVIKFFGTDAVFPIDGKLAKHCSIVKRNRHLIWFFLKAAKNLKMLRARIKLSAAPYWNITIYFYFFNYFISHRSMNLFLDQFSNLIRIRLNGGPLKPAPISFLINQKPTTAKFFLQYP